MKTVLAILLCAASFSEGLHSQSVFEEKDWNTSLAKAKEENKLLFVDGYTTWCYWCKVMDKETFPNPKVSTFLDAHFVEAKIDMEQEFGTRLRMKYHVDGYPTYLVFNPQGALLYQIVGYEDTTSFLHSLTASLQPDSQLHVPGYSSNLHLAFPDFYIKGSGRNWFPSDSILLAYLDKQTDLFSEVNWAVMSKYGAHFPKYAEFVLENKNKFIDLFGSPAVNEFIQNVLAAEFYMLIKKKDERLLEEYLKRRNELVGAKADTMFYKMDFYLANGNDIKLISEMEQVAKEKGKDTLSIFNDFCWHIYEACDNADYIHRATKIMEKVAATHDFVEMDTYAGLLFKDKQYVKAKEEATAALDEARKENRKAEGAERLLGYIDIAQGNTIKYIPASTCDYAILMYGRYFPICPSIDTEQIYDGASSFKDTAFLNDGLQYKVKIASWALKYLAASPISLFSIKAVKTEGFLNGKISITERSVNTPYEAQIIEGLFTEETKQKILQLKKGDTVTFKNLYLNDGRTVVPTEIQLRVVD